MTVGLAYSTILFLNFCQGLIILQSSEDLLSLLWYYEISPTVNLTIYDREIYLCTTQASVLSGLVEEGHGSVTKAMHLKKSDSGPSPWPKWPRVPETFEVTPSLSEELIHTVGFIFLPVSSVQETCQQGPN